MKNYLVTIEDIYRQESSLRAENEAEAGEIVRKTALEMNMGIKRCDDFCGSNFYLREAGEPGEKNHLLGSIAVRSIPVGDDDEDEDVCAMCEERDDCCCGEMCAACDEDDCDNCPFGSAESDDEPDDFDDEDCECPMEEVMAYLSIICDQLESLTSLLEKVCKASPEK